MVRDAIDRVEKRLGTGFQAVGGNAAASMKPAVVLEFHVHFRLRVFAERDGLYAKIFADSRHPGQPLDAQEHGIHGAIARGDRVGHVAVAVAKRERD